MMGIIRNTLTLYLVALSCCELSIEQERGPQEITSHQRNLHSRNKLMALSAVSKILQPINYNLERDHEEKCNGKTCSQEVRTRAVIRSERVGADVPAVKSQRADVPFKSKFTKKNCDSRRRLTMLRDRKRVLSAGYNLQVPYEDICQGRTCDTKMGRTEKHHARIAKRESKMRRMALTDRSKKLFGEYNQVANYEEKRGEKVRRLPEM